MSEEVKQVVLVRGDDWSGLYVDGKLEAENHRVDIFHDLPNLLGVPLILREPQNIDEDWLWDHGSPLPDDLCNVQVLDE